MSVQVTARQRAVEELATTMRGRILSGTLPTAHGRRKWPLRWRRRCGSSTTRAPEDVQRVGDPAVWDHLAHATELILRTN